MSVLSVMLLIAFIAVFIWIKRDDKRKWKTVHEAFGHKSREIQKRYGYLRRKGIRCRLKNYTPGTVRMVGMQGGQMSTQSTVLLQVHLNDIEEAHKYLAEFNGSNQ